MEVANPRRILAIEQPNSGILSLLKDITGSSPVETTDTPAGLSHMLKLDTSYYKATIPIWIDQIPASDPAEWVAEYLKPEAREVLMVLGAFVLAFRKPVDAEAMERVKGSLQAVGQVIRKGCGYSWDGVCLAVGMPQRETPRLEVEEEEWERICMESRFEWIDAEGKGRNEFGEPVGLERLREALEANDWTGDDMGDFDKLGEDDRDDENGFSVEAAEMEQEMLGLKMAMQGEGQDEEDEDQEFQVEQLEAMMLKMKAVKDMSEDLPEAERRVFAAKAVHDIMKTL